MATILVVDDDEAFRTMLRRTLERLGHHVIEAAEGGAALRALSAASVDLVITDIIMPDMEGLETIQTLRRTHPQLRIIAMSGGGRAKPDSYLEGATAFGAFRILRKPFNTEQLVAAVTAALE